MLPVGCWTRLLSRGDGRGAGRAVAEGWVGSQAEVVPALAGRLSCSSLLLFGLGW